MKKLALSAALLWALVSFAEVVSEKSPDGRNEIRITTEPVLSYSVYRDGKERVSSTPISMTFEGKGQLGGKAGRATVKMSARVPHSARISTPIYKKALVADDGNETCVLFDGGWKLFLHARNDGVAYRFATEWNDNQTETTKKPKSKINIF